MKNTRVVIIASVLLMMGCAHYIENTSNSGIILPKVKDIPVLIYPKSAQRNNYTGNTTVQIFISKTGNVIDAKVLRSSGYVVLDDAAKDYCEKITFYPAKVNGIPINSKSIYKVKFDLSDQESIERAYIFEIKKLYNEILEAAEYEKYDIQKEILMTHKEFIGNMVEGSDYNKMIMKILIPDIAEEWKAFMKYCPLTFLVYHDFLTRFPDFKDISDVKIELKKTIDLNIEMLQKIPLEKFDNPLEKENLLLRIKNFIQQDYPELNINNNVLIHALNS